MKPEGAQLLELSGQRAGGIAQNRRSRDARGQQSNFDTECIEPASPMVRRATGFHDHRANATVGKPAFHWRARQAVLRGDPLGAVGHGELEHGIRNIDSHNGQSGGSIHPGYLFG